jgi:hypothetical protein
MMKIFMISGSLTWGMELDDVLSESDTMPFSEEDVVVIVYGGCPTPRRCHMYNLSPETPTHCGWGHEDTGM